MPPNLTNVFPRHLWALVVVYFVASLAHFVHNAEYIAFYPNMPAWITREKVYFAWLGITCVGISGLAVYRFGLRAMGVLLVGVYGAFGLDGLAHYTLALCSEHTLATNITIWSEASAGLVLMTASMLFLGHGRGALQRSKSTAVVLAPQIKTPTRSSSPGR